MENITNARVETRVVEICTGTENAPIPATRTRKNFDPSPPQFSPKIVYLLTEISDNKRRRFNSRYHHN